MVRRKMLIIPSLVDDSCDHDLIVTEFCRIQTSKFGMIALVPSTKNCKQYQNLGAIITTAESIFEELDNLKKANFQKLL